MTSSRPDRLRVAAAAAAYVLIGAAALVAWNSPASAYEVSIYACTPLSVWVGVVIALTCSIAIVVHDACAREHTQSRMWVLGFGGILLGNALILSLHVMRGYAFWYACGDPGSHVGITQSVLATGHFQSDNMYPMLHLLVAAASSVTGLEVAYLGSVMPLFFTILGMVFVYLWMGTVLSSRRAVLLATVAGTMLVGGWYLNFTPNHAANMVFPMFLFLIGRSMSTHLTKGTALLLLLFVFFLPLLHPVAAFTLIFCLASLWLPSLLTRLRGYSGKQSRVRLRTVWSITPVLGVWTVVWVSGFRVWISLWRLFLQTAGGAMASTIERAQYAATLGYDVTAFFFRNYFDLVFFGCMALVAFPHVLRAVRDKGQEGRLFSLYGSLAAISILYLLTYFVNMYGMQRTEVYIILLAAPFAGFVLSELGNCRRLPRNAVTTGIWLGLVLLSVLGILKVYPSPYLHSFNAQVTYAEIEGMQWFFQNDAGYEVAGMNAAPGRMADFLLYSERFTEEGKRYSMYIPETLQDTVYSAYDEYPKMGCGYENDAYLVFSELDHKLYTDIYPELAEIRFNPGKFGMFDYDPSLGKLYVSSGFEVWSVLPETCEGES